MLIPRLLSSRCLPGEPHILVVNRYCSNWPQQGEMNEGKKLRRSSNLIKHSDQYVCVHYTQCKPSKTQHVTSAPFPSTHSNTLKYPSRRIKTPTPLLTLTLPFPQFSLLPPYLLLLHLLPPPLDPIQRNKNPIPTPRLIPPHALPYIISNLQPFLSGDVRSFPAYA